MAVQTTEEFKNGGATSYAITIEYLQASDIKVRIGGALQTYVASSPSSGEYTVSGTTVTLGAQAAAGTGNVHIYRETDVDTAAAVFAAGSSIRAADLNAIHDMARFGLSEARSITIESDIKDGAVTSAKILDGTIVNADINASAAIDGTKISPNFGSQNIVTSGTVDGRDVSTDGTKLDGIEAGATADQTADEIRALIDNASDSNVLTDTLVSKLNAIEAGATADQTNAEIRAAVEAASDSNVFTDADHSKLNSIDADATDDQTASEIKTLIASSPLDASHLAANSVTSSEIANNSVNSDHYVDGSIDREHLAAGIVDGTKLADNAVQTAKIQDNAVTSAKILDTAVTTSKIANTNVTDAKLASNSVTTSKITDANVTTVKVADSNITLAKLASDLKQTTISNSDTQLPTSGAVVDYVAAQIAPIGGLEVIANDASFPNTQPQAGVVISIADAGGLVVNGSGTSTTARTLGGSTVTINNINSSYNNSTVTDGVGFLVSSTGSGQIYNFHKSVIRDQDILSISTDINDFANRYRVASSAPTSSKDDGDLWFDTANGKMMVYNANNTAWEEVSAVGNFNINTISSSGNTGGGSATFNGSAYRFTISNPPQDAQQLLVSINGVIQKPNTGTSQPSEGFAISGNDIIFSAAPASGSSSFIITIGQSVQIGTPSDGAVSTSKLASGAVTTAKIADNAVTTAKLASGATDLIADTSPQLGGHLDCNNKVITMNDSSSSSDNRLKLGNAGDLQIYHSGSDSVLTSATGSLNFGINNAFNILGGTDLGEYMARFIDNGAVQLYYDGSKKFETTANGAKISGTAAAFLEISTTSGAHNPMFRGSNGDRTFDTGLRGDFSDSWCVYDVTAADLRLEVTTNGDVNIPNDSKKLQLGASQDLQIYHDGSFNFIRSENGHPVNIIKSTTENIAKFIPDGAVELYYDNSKKLDTHSGGINVTGSVNPTGNVALVDNSKVKLGTGDDLQIYHDGTDSHIQNTNNSGELKIRAHQTDIKNADNNETQAIFHENGAVELFYDNSKKFETISDGAKVTGRLQVTNYLEFDDNVEAYWGNSHDLQIYHDGSFNRFRGANFIFNNAAGNQSIIEAYQAGAVQLYHNNSKKLETESSGARTYGDHNVTGEIHLTTDNQSLKLGAGADLKLKHDGTTNLILTEGPDIKIGTGGETFALFKNNNAVELYYDNSKKLETTSTGFHAHGTQFKYSDTGDVELILNADTNNSGEENNPRILFQQDGSSNCLAIGVEGSTGGHYTNSSQNSPYFEALDGHGGLGIEFATNNTRRMRINHGGTIDGDFNDTSDGNLKENIVSISSTIDKVKSLRPVTFDWKDKTKEKNYSGFIAQEVKAIYPNIVTGEEHTTEEPWKNYSLNTTGLVAYLTKALQEAITKIETLETKVAALEAK